MKQITNKQIILKCYIQFAKYISNPTRQDELIRNLSLIEKEYSKGKRTDKSLWFKFFNNDTSATTIKNITIDLNLPEIHTNKIALFECIIIAINELSLEIYYS